MERELSKSFHRPPLLMFWLPLAVVVVRLTKEDCCFHSVVKVFVSQGEFLCLRVATPCLDLIFLGVYLQDSRCNQDGINSWWLDDQYANKGNTIEDILCIHGRLLKRHISIMMRFPANPIRIYD